LSQATSEGSAPGKGIFQQVKTKPTGEGAAKLKNPAGRVGRAANEVQKPDARWTLKWWVRAKTAKIGPK
jgi:hypothetical protein